MKLAEQFTKINGSEEFQRQYWEGFQNIFVRYYTYFREGLSLANEGKYILGLLGLGIFKSDITFTWQMLSVGALIGVPVLCFIGRWNLFKGNKARQYITTQHGNIFQWQDHNMIVTQVELLEIIAKKLSPDEYKKLIK